MGKKKKSAAEIAKNMAAIRSTGARTEQEIRSILHRSGLRFRKNYRLASGKPDIAFLTERIAVFIDGDYWHGRMLREQGAQYLQTYFDEKQQIYWAAKLQRNVARDDFVTATLEAEGWMVIRIWESNARRDPGGTARVVFDAVIARRSAYSHEDR